VLVFLVEPNSPSQLDDAAGKEEMASSRTTAANIGWCRRLVPSGGGCRVTAVRLPSLYYG